MDTLETGSKIVVLLASIELTGINTWVVVASQLVLSIFSVGTVVVFSGVDAAVVDIVDAGDVIRGGSVGTIAEVTSNGVNVFLMILTEESTVMGAVMVAPTTVVLSMSWAGRPGKMRKIMTGKRMNSSFFINAIMHQDRKGSQKVRVHKVPLKL